MPVFQKKDVQCFLMDEQRAKAVTEAFVRLYKDGLIYRLVFHILESSVICMWYLWFYIDKVCVCFLYYVLCWNFPILIDICTSSGRIALIPHWRYNFVIFLFSFFFVLVSNYFMAIFFSRKKRLFT